MAFCPKCQGDMGPTEAVCPHCGYDFPTPVRRRTPGWVYLILIAAWVAFLIMFRDTLVGQIITSAVFLLTVVSLFLGVWGLLRGD